MSSCFEMMTKSKSVKRKTTKADEVKRANRAEAVACALLSEMEGRDSFADLVASASVNSGMDITEFWKEHSEKDDIMIMECLKDKFSTHQIKQIKSALNRVDDV